MGKIKLLMGGFMAFLPVLALMSTPVSAASSVVYNNIESPQPGNVSSWGYEATSTSEMGGQVGLAGSNRVNPKVTVLMSSWGCENGNWFNNDCSTTPGATFSHPVTLNIYSVGAGNAAGALLATKTETFNIPYRPSVDTLNCSDGRWYDGSTCFNGLATPISFQFSNLTLPNNAIISVAYNTSHYGYAPMGELACFSESGGCGYDSLNVGLETVLSVGTQPIPDDGYLNSSSAGSYCSGPAGTFRLDTGCWTGYQPSFKVEADSPSASTLVVTSANQQGWVFNPDPVNATPYEFTTDKESIGSGSLYVKPIAATPAKKFIATKALNIPVSSLNSLAYDFLIAGNGTAASANQFYLNVYTNLPSSSTFYDCRFDFVPTTGSTSSFTTANFSSTTTATNVADRPTDSFTCPTTLSAMPAGSTISFIALNVGDTSASDVGLAGYLDKVVVDTYSNVTTYDFEAIPLTKDDCKKDAWKAYGMFKNQGDCVSFVATGGRNQPAGPTF